MNEAEQGGNENTLFVNVLKAFHEETNKPFWDAEFW